MPTIRVNEPPKRFLILKTVDGSEHRGWLDGTVKVDGIITYYLNSPDGRREVAAPLDKIVYVEVLYAGHSRITMAAPDTDA